MVYANLPEMNKKIIPKIIIAKSLTTHTCFFHDILNGSWGFNHAKSHQSDSLDSNVLPNDTLAWKNIKKLKMFL